MKDWDRINMVDACELITCGVAARPKYVDDGVPFLSAKNVKEGKIIYQNYNCITIENHEELTKKNKPLVGDLLYTRVGSFGEAAVIEEDIEFSIFVSLTLIKPKRELLNSYFLKYYLNSHEVKTLAKNSITSSGVGNLNVGAVRKFPTPIPPLSEQKQIVALLDQAFTAIDQAKANIEKNIVNAKELFQSKLNDIFSQKGDGWEEKSLGEIADFKNGLNFTKSSVGEVIKLVGVADFKNRFHIPTSKLVDIQIKGSLNENYYLKEGDILTVRSNGNPKLIGRCLVAKDIIEKTSHSGFTIRIRANQTKINPEYLCHYLKSTKSRNELINSGTGINIKSLNQGALSVLKISYPISLVSQELIFNQITELSLRTSKIENKYKHKLKDLEELKKSILQKAFSGELTQKEGVV